VPPIVIPTTPVAEAVPAKVRSPSIFVVAVPNVFAPLVEKVRS
jgi:hypothetical protein